MLRRPPCSSRPDPLFPFTTLFRSPPHAPAPVAASERSPNSPPPDQAPAIPAAAPRKPPAPDSQRTAHPPHPPSAKPPPPAPRRCAPKAVQSPAAPAHPPSTAQSRPPAFQIHRQPHARQPGCQPLRNPAQNLLAQGQHRLPPKRLVRLAIVGIGIVARQPHQHRRHPECERNFPRRSSFQPDEIHIRRRHAHRLPLEATQIGRAHV